MSKRNEGFGIKVGSCGACRCLRISYSLAETCGSCCVYKSFRPLKDGIHNSRLSTQGKLLCEKELNATHSVYLPILHNRKVSYSFK